MTEFYTLKEVATHFRLSVRTLYRWIDEGKNFDISVLKKTPHGHYLVPRYEVDRLSNSFDIQKTK